MSANTNLPAGTWSLIPTASRLGFSARGSFGLLTVHGRFTSAEGELVADQAGASGELRIEATSLDTGNSMRDKHLRSPDFFDVEQYPVVSFTLAAISESPDGGAELTGDLKIGQNSLRIVAPLTIDASAPDTLRLETELSVDRSAAGIGWSRMGMIKGPAVLEVSAVLSRTSPPSA